MEDEALDVTKSSQAQQSSSSRESSQAGNNTFLLRSRPINYTSNNNNMPLEDSDRNKSIMARIEFAVNLINQMLIGFAAIYMSWMCIKFDLKKTALHAWLVTIGFNFLMAEGVMTHYNGNILLFNYSRKSKTTIHWVLQALGGSLGIAGGIVKICQKETHFTTIHGKVGLAALIICGISMLSGLSALYSQNLKRLLQPLLNKTVHNFLGLCGFVLAMVAQYYGYETGFFKFQTEAGFRIMMQVITILTICCCCWGPLKALWVKCKIIKENF
ncbi:transmembrane reductase CYB561D2-like [Episyrphus balteatus]|uniref:transmembrane reductase CYB561D2-like n=1 Tax=Episyrphus balteatus TaxID=286459 RepID=UPI00248641A8|nr:transmembrane reductase CYB561D2-like [Episyrphus balteatus]XP_055851024.1 transmembrane reductase CYB561D2-like [Episyrphus balteatus]XP_055851025.1 transmembrane reductase CYB561D2-like [Episyrphus balteatus]